MKRRIVLHDKTVAYAIKTSKRARRMRVAVYCDSTVVVTLPNGFAESKVEHFLRIKAAWVLDKIAYFKTLGNTVRLPNGKRAFKKYREEAYGFVERKIEEINKIYNYSYNKIVIKNHKTRWGSCSKKRNINFNYRIIFLPERLAEYIIAHELCHLGAFDHSRKFWSLVEKSIPDFRKCIKELNTLVRL
jgi:hypothetical protein